MTGQEFAVVENKTVDELMCVDCGQDHSKKLEYWCDRAASEIKIDVLNDKITKLEDQLYHDSRRADEVEYLLGDKITKLEQAIEIAKIALEKYVDSNALVYYDTITKDGIIQRRFLSGQCAKEALEKIKAIKEAK